MDGPAGRPADNPPNLDRLRVYHRNVPELNVRVYWQPGLLIWQRLSLGPDLDPTWRSWTVANTRSYDLQAHQQCSQRRCFSQTALLWFQVLPDLSPVLVDLSLALPGLLHALAGAPRLVVGAPRCSQVHQMFSPVLRGVPKPLTITPMVLLYLLSQIPVTLKAGRNAPLGSDTLLKLTHLSLHSTSSQILQEAPSD